MARRKRLDCTIVLLSRGAQVNSQSKDGSTPLHQAALASLLPVFHFILIYIAFFMSIIVS